MCDIKPLSVLPAKQHLNVHYCRDFRPQHHWLRPDNNRHMPANLRDHSGYAKDTMRQVRLMHTCKVYDRKAVGIGHGTLSISAASAPVQEEAEEVQHAGCPAHGRGAAGSKAQ